MDLCMPSSLSLSAALDDAAVGGGGDGRAAEEEEIDGETLLAVATEFEEGTVFCGM